MKKSITTKALIGISLSLSGCMGVYEGGFECPPGEGVGCKSISEVNHMVDQGLGSKNPSPQSAQKTEHSPTCKNGSGSCSATSEIWYAPSVILDQNKKIDSQNKCTPKVLDDAHSI